MESSLSVLSRDDSHSHSFCQLSASMARGESGGGFCELLSHIVREQGPILEVWGACGLGKDSGAHLDVHSTVLRFHTSFIEGSTSIL